MIFQKKNKKETALRKELAALKKKEERLKNAAIKADRPSWKTELTKKIPPKALSGLENAFAKGFCLVFEKGTFLIEKTYDTEALQQDHAISDYAFQLKGGRRELKNLYRKAGASQLGNMTITTVEGIGLGALGVGLPDVVLFLAMLLKGIYEIAISYGFSYDTPAERFWILKMMETSLCTGEAWVQGNQEVEQFFTNPEEITDELLQTQIQQTGRVFAMDMLMLKFIQGLPVVGILGGAGNPVYYNKVMRYVQLKYQMRYLTALAQKEAPALFSDPDTL